MCAESIALSKDCRSSQIYAYLATCICWNSARRLQHTETLLAIFMLKTSSNKAIPSEAIRWCKHTIDCFTVGLCIGEAILYMQTIANNSNSKKQIMNACPNTKHQCCSYSSTPVQSCDTLVLF